MTPFATSLISLFRSCSAGAFTARSIRRLRSAKTYSIGRLTFRSRIPVLFSATLTRSRAGGLIWPRHPLSLTRPPTAKPDPAPRDGACFVFAALPHLSLRGYGVFFGQNRTASQGFILLEIFFTSLCFGPINALLIETVPVAQRSAASAIFVICAYGLSNVISADLIGAISDKQNLRVGMLIAPTAFLLSAFLLLTYTLLP